MRLANLIEAVPIYGRVRYEFKLGAFLFELKTLFLQAKVPLTHLSNPIVTSVEPAKKQCQHRKS